MNMKTIKLAEAFALIAIAIGMAFASASSASLASSRPGGLLLAASFPDPAGLMTAHGVAGSLLAGETAALTRRGIAPARASEAIEVQGEVARADLVRKLTAALGSAYAGVWFEPAAAQLHIGVIAPASRRAAEAVLARAGLAAHATATPVHSTWAQLQAAQKRWNRRLADLFARADAETALAPERNAVAVTLSSSVPIRERIALEREAKASAVSVLVSAVHYPQLRLIPDAETKCNLFVANSDEAYCDKPITAGVTIESRNKRALCTAGPLTVPVADKGRTYLLTAGHCIEKGLREAKWYAWDTAGGARKEIGRAARQYINGRTGDVGAINVSRAGQWAEPGNTPAFAVTAEWRKAEEKSFPVKGERAPMVGASNCVEGQTSGGTCGTIKRVGVTFGIKEGLVEEEGDAISAPGDSGGPVIAETKGEYLVEGTDVDHTVLEDSAIWEPVETAFTLLNTLNLELLTPANEARPAKESAKEKEENEKYEKEEKEGGEKVEKEEREEKEKEEKEGKPLILPVPTVETPLHFTATSGKTILETSKEKIECKEGTFNGEFATVREGTATLDLHGCKSAGIVACKSLGNKAETILTRANAALVDLEKSKLTLGVEVAPNEIHIVCGTVLVLVRGAAIGEVSGVESGKSTKTATLLFKQEKGKQAIRECRLTKTLCEGKKINLEANVSGKGFEEAGEETEVKLTLAKEATFDF